jgi:cephalosporin hydroxylase
MAEGLKIDLANCNYGETTGPCPFIKRPTNYYYFLAGLVRSQGMTRILEIGTHFGGSIMSMSRGLNKKDRPQSKLVTVDIEHKNRDGFKEYPHIERITGDSLDEDVIKKVWKYFERPIDLIYIDSIHEYEHTKKNIDIYARKLDPRYIVLDDIRQCDSMAQLWSTLTEKFKGNAFDASDISIRKGAGFGVIKWRKA